MFSAKVYERLQNITYLSSLSKKNIAVMSKPNDYGDVVKFMAQINKEDVIQKIRFKATGCSHFIALLSYFCEIVEGKSVTDALKIKEKDLIKFDVLEESRHHIYPIILDTFALMIKKYRKGVEKGLIEPCEVVVEEVVEKKTTKKEKKVDIHDGLHEILVTRKSKKTENTDDETQVKETKVEVAKTRKSLKSSSIADENVETQVSSVKTQKKASKVVNNEENNIKKDIIDTKTEEDKLPEVLSKKVVKEKKVKNSQLETIPESQEVVAEKTEDKQVEKEDDLKVKTTKEKAKKESAKKETASKEKAVKKSTKKETKTAEIVVENDDNQEENIETSALVVVEEAPSVIISEENVVEEPIVSVKDNAPVAHTKVEHRKTITKQKTIQVNDEIHTDVIVEHTEVEMEHISPTPVINNTSSTMEDYDEIDNLDIPVVEIDDEKPKKVKKEKVKAEKVKKEKPEKKVKEKAVAQNLDAKTNVETDANKAKAEHLKKLQLGLTGTKSNQTTQDNSQNKANNLNSMLSRLNAKHQEQGTTTITTRQTRIEVTKKSSTSEKTETREHQASNLASMRSSLLSLRSQSSQTASATEDKSKAIKSEKVKKEKIEKEKKVKAEKSKKVEKELDEDGVEVVYLDDESRKDAKEKKGFFTRLFKR